MLTVDNLLPALQHHQQILVQARLCEAGGVSAESELKVPAVMGPDVHFHVDDVTGLVGGDEWSSLQESWFCVHSVIAAETVAHRRCRCLDGRPDTAGCKPLHSGGTAGREARGAVVVARGAAVTGLRAGEEGVPRGMIAEKHNQEHKCGRRLHGAGYNPRRHVSRGKAAIKGKENAEGV